MPEPETKTKYSLITACPQKEHNGKKMHTNPVNRLLILMSNLYKHILRSENIPEHASGMAEKKPLLGLCPLDTSPPYPAGWSQLCEDQTGPHLLTYAPPRLWAVAGRGV